MTTSTRAFVAGVLRAGRSARDVVEVASCEVAPTLVCCTPHIGIESIDAGGTAGGAT
jgi:hypothetical protein